MNRSSAPIEERIKADEVRRIQKGIEAAFNLYCPIDGCGATLDQVEGCNAATCSDPDCGQRFCYLCLKTQMDTRSAHAHLIEHSGAYWERRPGYADRYKWLLIRRNLAYLFKSKVTDEIRAEALSWQEALLKQNKMWPMPAGKKSQAWLQEVESANLSPEDQVELLQNECIYRRKFGEMQSVSLIEAALRQRGAKVLASLDVIDAAGVPAGWDRLDQQNRDAAVVHAQLDEALEVRPGQRRAGMITPVFDGHPNPGIVRLVAQLRQYSPQFYALGGFDGRIYLVRDPERRVNRFLLADSLPIMRTQEESMRFCEERGAKIPTSQQLLALSRALTPDGGEYNGSIIPSLENELVWLSDKSARGDNQYFKGRDGRLGKALYGTSPMHSVVIRCVRDLGKL